MPVATAADFAAPPALVLPLACHAGVDCFVQNYVDHAGPTPRDHHCGSQTYAGHDGSDFRLTSTAAQRRGVAVLAAAPGTVRALRDGVADHLIENAADQAAIAGRECGNGVVIDHPGGWQSQYCHMARGSLAVRVGQRVVSGERLGLVGLSGDTRFPHVHFSLRHDGKVVDPFAPQMAAGGCGAGDGGLRRAGQRVFTPGGSRCGAAGGRLP
jgi:murein DD-endopeptidase MepM/ murein hydrolase activator NlpD